MNFTCFIRKYRQYKKSVESGLGEDIGFKQVSWMGRGCYKKMSDNSYLIGKGTGPGLGSEFMRRFLYDLQLNWAETEGKYGGCIRVNLSEQWPFLVQYKLDEDGNVEIIDPRPEGFSIFGATYREALVGNIYDNLGIEIVKPVSLYRENSLSIWDGDQELFRNELSKKVVGELSLWNSNINSFLIRHDDYHDLDSGILFRHAKTPFRISNLLDVCIDNDISSFEDIVAGLLNKNEISLEDIRKLQSDVTKTLSKNAALMYKNGIIHGQFKVHYQNISVLGELSDFDSTVFLSLLNRPDLINTLYSDTLEKVEKFKSNLLIGEKDLSLDMYKFVIEDLGIFAGLKGNGEIDLDVLYSNMIGQIYDLFNQTMRLNDLFERYNVGEISVGKAVLSEDRYNELMDLFVNNFKNFLLADDLIFIKDILTSYFEAYRNLYLSRNKGDVSIYGWKDKEKLNYLKDVFTEEDIDNTLNEAKKLFGLLLN